MSIMEYEREFLRLSRYAKNMFQTECMTLVEMKGKAYNMEFIIKDKSKSFESERMKRGKSSPPPPSSFKKPKD